MRKCQIPLLRYKERKVIKEMNQIADDPIIESILRTGYPAYIRQAELKPWRLKGLRRGQCFEVREIEPRSVWQPGGAGTGCSKAGDGAGAVRSGGEA